MMVSKGSWKPQPFKMKVVCSFHMSGNTKPSTQHHMPVWHTS